MSLIINYNSFYNQFKLHFIHYSQKQKQKKIEILILQIIMQVKPNINSLQKHNQ